MDIIPAIELKAGKSIRITQGKFEQQNLHTDDPLTIAKRWVREGATRLHIVDIDGARIGNPSTAHLTLIRDLARRLQVPIQLGGGIRSREVIQRLLNVGIDRVILGTATVADPLISEIFHDFGERIVVAIDARAGMVAVNGWQQMTEMPALQFAQKMERAGARRIIFTDITRTEATDGVNLAAVQSLLKAVSIPIVASGGVSSVADIQDLRASGAEGAILGKALYENKLMIADAIAVSRGQAPPARQAPAAPQHYAGAPSAYAQQQPAQPQQPQRPPAPPPVAPQPRPQAPAPPPAQGAGAGAPAKPYLPWMNGPKR